ncbi:pentatricopeptide repeat-containing protein, partial [Trifolium medium]|nr:pentatricopeptide repeat-containing protein [Trifolium medium]
MFMLIFELPLPTLSVSDKCWALINSWSSRHLSQAGREVMIKSVLQSIGSYVMSIFLLPKILIAEIEKMLNSFWWGRGNSREVCIGYLENVSQCQKTLEEWVSKVYKRSIMLCLNWLRDGGSLVQPLSSPPMLDHLKKLENDGGYTVRSAYKLCVHIAGIKERHGVAGSWSQIWCAKIPLKVKTLLWRIARNCLPTRVRLAGRGINCPTTCAVCNEENEDNPGNTTTATMFLILQNPDLHQQDIFSVMLWSIWKRRNNQVWEQIAEMSQIVCDRASNLIMSWRNAQQIRNSADVTRTVSPITTWIKPVTG